MAAPDLSVGRFDCGGDRNDYQIAEKDRERLTICF